MKSHIFMKYFLYFHYLLLLKATNLLTVRRILQFNDLLLVCKEWVMRRIAGYMGYNVVMSLPVDGMNILDCESSPANDYVIIVKTKSFVLHLRFDTEEEKLDWLKVLFNNCLV